MPNTFRLLDRTTLPLSVALILVLVSNSGLLSYQHKLLFPEASRISDALRLTPDFLLLFLFFYAILLLIARFSRLFFWIVPLLFALGSIPNFFAHTYKISAEEMTTAIWQSNPIEAKGFVDSTLILCILGALVLGIIFTLPAKTWTRREIDWSPGQKAYRAATATALLVTVSLAVTCLLVFGRSSHLVHRFKTAYFPLALFMNGGNLAKREEEFRKRLEVRRDIFTDPMSLETQNEDLIVVLVIGESARAKSFSLNGYERETNPNLATIRNLVSFTNAWACYTYTYLAVPCLLTRGNVANIDQHVGTETSIISGFRKLGFLTAWLSTTSHRAGEKEIGYAANMYLLAQEAEEQRFAWDFTERNDIKNTANTSDPESLFPPFDDILAKRRRSFVIFHTQGSHAPYNRSYIKGKNIKFQTNCHLPSQCDDTQSLINAYDNTIVHTDEFLARIIKKLEKRNALFLYMSDHGESIGEDLYGKYVGSSGTFGHGSDTARLKELILSNLHPEQRHIPMIWWASDSFLADAKNASRFAKLRRRDGLKVSHENVFHSLLDCAGVNTQAKDPELSLCGLNNPPDYFRLLKN